MQLTRMALFDIIEWQVALVIAASKSADVLGTGLCANSLRGLGGWPIGALAQAGRRVATAFAAGRIQELGKAPDKWFAEVVASPSPVPSSDAPVEPRDEEARFYCPA